LENYRRNAEKCFDLAQRFNDPESKRSLLAMANAWLMLAERHLKSSKAVPVSEMPTKRSISPCQPKE